MSTAAVPRPSRSWPVAQVVAVLLLLGLVGAMAVEPTRRLLEQRRRIAGMVQGLHEVERSNRALEERIARLQDPDFVEQRARELGLVLPGEVPLVVLPPSKAQRRHAKRSTTSPVPRTAQDLPWLDGFLHFVGVAR